MPARKLRAAWAGVFLPLVFAAQAPGMKTEVASHLLREPGRILLRTFRFDVADGPPSSTGGFERFETTLNDTRYWLVHYQGPVSGVVREAIAERGGQVLSYVPNGTYLVRMNPVAARSLQGIEWVSWVGPYRPDYKVSPDIGRRTFQSPGRGEGETERLLVLSAFEGEDLHRIAQEASEMDAQVLGVNRHPATPRILVRARVGLETDLSGIEGLEWIEEAGEITPRNNTTRWVAQSNQWNETPVWDAGLHGEGQIIGHIDYPLRITSCYFEDTLDNTPGPNHRKIVAYRGSPGGILHGTHTAGTAVGRNFDGSLDNAGIAYAAKLSHTRIELITGFGGTPTNLYSFLEAAHADGARVHSNSWGDDGLSSYTTLARDIDRFSRDFEEDLVIFAASNLALLRTPENAKNVLAVSASEQAPNQDQHGAGGTGPTFDGRRKPEICLPGVGIVSASTAVCGVASLFGTSMACAAVSASAALVRQYYEEGFYPSGAASAKHAFISSAALVKATLLNGSEDMAGVAGYPSDLEGWGRLSLDEVLHFVGDGRTTVAKDVRHANGLNTGGVDQYVLDVGTNESFEVTLVFTDQPAALGALLAPVNDLDLEIVGPDGLFRGNVFSGGASAMGGTSDNLNNVERVRLEAGGFTAGIWTVRVRGTSVPDGPQGYALHAAGAVVEVTATAAPSPEPVVSGKFLAQNNPNPFSVTTSIAFVLPERNEVTLAVFDIAGRRVRTLVEGPVDSGEYTLSWDGRDALGTRVAPGIYFYRLFGKDLDETKKLVMLR